MNPAMCYISYIAHCRIHFAVHNSKNHQFTDLITLCRNYFLCDGVPPYICSVVWVVGIYVHMYCFIVEMSTMVSATSPVQIDKGSSQSCFFVNHTVTKVKLDLSWTQHKPYFRFWNLRQITDLHKSRRNISIDLNVWFPYR